MSVIAVIGDCTTTTSLALASAWPSDSDVVVVEADRSGGSLTAWLDTPPTPSLSTIVANARTLDGPASAAWSTVDSMVQRAASGVRFIAAPVRSREANRAIGEAESALFPMLAGMSAPTFLADLGRHDAADSAPVLASLASTIVVCHRQDDSSAAAATVRLERLAELVGMLAQFGAPIIVALIGDRPFERDEIERFVSLDADVALAVHVLPIDELTAAVFAGRTGVSERRLARLPLMRAARELRDALVPNVATGPQQHVRVEPVTS